LTVQHRLAREDSVVPSEKDKSKEQKAAESEVESFRKDLGPFVVAEHHWDQTKDKHHGF
jgi:hypothetical protein